MKTALFSELGTPLIHHDTDFVVFVVILLSKANFMNVCEM